MTFTTSVCSEEEFNAWVSTTQALPTRLNAKEYIELAKPTKHKEPASYVLETKDLYDQILMQYMMPNAQIK